MMEKISKQQIKRLWDFVMKNSYIGKDDKSKIDLSDFYIIFVVVFGKEFFEEFYGSSNYVNIIAEKVKNKEYSE